MSGIKSGEAEPKVYQMIDSTKEWALAPWSHDPLGYKQSEPGDRFGRHLFMGLHKVSDLHLHLTNTLTSDITAFGKAIVYVAFRVISFVRLATTLFSLLGSTALTALTLPLYKTAVNRYFRVCLLNSVSDLKDTLRKMPFIFEGEWIAHGLRRAQEKELESPQFQWRP